MVDCYEAMVRENRMHPVDRIRLMNQHNVNLHASEPECDAWLDSDEEEQREDISVIGEEEFFERYVD